MILSAVLIFNGLQFVFSLYLSVVVDPSNLCDGLHYYEVYGIDCKAPWRGPIFRIPITITKAKAVTNQPLQVSFSDMLFQPGLH
jgi:tripeptidyl-peptidase II